MSSPDQREFFAATMGDGAVVTQWAEKPDAMLFVFSGMPLTPTKWAPFQLVQATKDLNVDKVYLRDPRRAWYQLGLEPHTSAIDDSAVFLQDLIIERAPRRIVSLGVSSGGFAAILFGGLLGVDEVHAIAPRTYVDIDNRIKNDDFFMDEFIDSLYSDPHAQPEYFDLRNVLAAQPATATRYFIHYSADRRIDVANARHLDGLPGVELIEYDYGGHQLGRVLRDNGKLATILANAVRPSAA